MFTEVGFFHGLYDSQVEVVKQLRADIIITNTLRYMLHRFELFPRQRLLQALTVPGVKAAYPLYFQSGEPSWRSAATRQPRPIRVLAFRPRRSRVLESRYCAPGDGLTVARHGPH